MYTYEKKDKQGILKIKISKENWEKAVNEVYEKTKGKFTVQGFRKGKAPKKVIEQTYGDTVFFDDAFENVINEEYNKFLTENKGIVPASYPRVQMDSFTVDSGIEATLTFDLMPEVKLGSFEGLKSKRKAVKITDAQVDAEIEREREKHARFVEEDKVCENGDFATIDFSGSVDGVKFDGGTAEDYRLELGSHTFIEGFEEQVVGMKKGESKDVNVVFPENYGAENLQGKAAVFAVTVKKVEKKVLPEVNDKFVSDTTEFETLDEYKKSIKEQLKKTEEEKAERDYEVALIDEIVDRCKLEIPHSMVDHEVEHMVEDFAHRLSHQGMKLEDYLAYIGKTVEQFKKERENDAEKNIKTRLVLQKIISKNNIAATSEELDAKIAEYAAQYGMSEEEFKKNLSPNDYAFFENNIVMTKLLDFIKSKKK